MWPSTCQWRPNANIAIADELKSWVTPYLAKLKQQVDPNWHRAIDRLSPVWCASPWAIRVASANPDGFIDLLQSGQLENEKPVSILQLEIGSEAALNSSLRRLRQREMLRIAIRDLMGWVPLETTLKDLSNLATYCIREAVSWSEAKLIEKYGVPRNAAGQRQQLIVYGMGKLGGEELNFSSDIDLIFFYPETGSTDGAKKLDNQQFFSRLGQQLIQLLDQVTDEGFVFRVDMRLRPFGDAGALVCSFATAEHYYQSQGRDWERYALIKARAVTGDSTSIGQLKSMLKPFVFRRYLDFSAIQSLSQLKQMINDQVAKQGMENNIKLGRGGIREIEFITQALQLIYGGRQPEFQTQSLVSALIQIKRKKLLPATQVDALLCAYTFLRFTENRLQMMQDAQTHDLPEDPLNQCRLAYAMRFTNWADFKQALGQHREIVAEQFAQFFYDAPTEPRLAQWQTIWQRGDEEALTQLPQTAGFVAPTQAGQCLAQLRHSQLYLKANAETRARLDKFIPFLIEAVAKQTNSINKDTALIRLIDFVRTVARRSIYLVFLQRNPVMLNKLIGLFANSAWLTEQLTAQPVLLDQLLETDPLCDLARRPTLDQQLEIRLSKVEEDIETQLHELRQFKHSYTVHVAINDLSEQLPLMQVSDHLTACAEVALTQANRLAWKAVTDKYGYPHCRDQNKTCNPSMAVIGYGKLGGIELGYSSDVDLVFLHDSRGEDQFTDGERSIDNTLFFTRQAQKLTHFLNTQTTAGRLYEVDTRLRPDGGSGEWVKSLEGFAHYQQTQAWTWEHQALIRARVICGSFTVYQQFQSIRQTILCQQRDLAKLKSEVIDMREKMRAHLLKPNSGFNLKQSHGGLTDIEFIVQFVVLGWAHQYPKLTRWTDNIRILKEISSYNILAEQDAKILIESYRAIRAKIHRLALDKQHTVVDNPRELATAVDAVANIWQQFMLKNGTSA